MLTINKNNKRLRDTINELIENIKFLYTSNPCLYASGKMSTPKGDSVLIDYYSSFGLDNYKIHITAAAIRNIPFNKNISLDAIKSHKNCRKHKIRAGKYEPSNYAISDKMLRRYVPFVVFDEDIEVPVICENSNEWMAPVLFEQETMKKPLQKATGNVLTFGLGIGYFQYNCLLKDDVSSVTIIERSSEVIEFFEKHILPQFPRQNDIKIIKGDAFDYFNNDFISAYDYTFVDIWKNNEDGLIIISKLLKNIELSKDLNIDFWVLDAILEDIKECLAVYIYQKVTKNINTFLKEPNEKGFITFKKIDKYFKKKSVRINNSSDLFELIHDTNNLLEILKSL